MMAQCSTIISNDPLMLRSVLAMCYGLTLETHS